MDQRIHEILDYWFGEIKNGFCVENRQKLWFMSTKKEDEEIEMDQHYMTFMKKKRQFQISIQESKDGLKNTCS